MERTDAFARPSESSRRRPDRHFDTGFRAPRAGRPGRGAGRPGAEALPGGAGGDGGVREGRETWRQQAWLVSLAGSWEFEGTFWSAPGSEPMKSSGTAERTALLGGRCCARSSPA